MAGDYVPHSEAELITWARGFVSFVEDHGAELGMPEARLAELQAQQAEFEAAHVSHSAAQTAARSACAAKDQAKRDLTKNLRLAAGHLQAHPAISTADKRGLGLSTGEPIRNPALAMANGTPVAIIDIGTRLTHILRIRNRTSTGVRKARPVEAVGCELWRRVGGSPDGVVGMQYLGRVGGSPYVVTYDAEDAGKTVHYAMRWVDTKGCTGGWSETESATIAA
jgi:fructose-specific component phosphotransferase system IIB-like protein